MKCIIIDEDEKSREVIEKVVSQIAHLTLASLCVPKENPCDEVLRPCCSPEEMTMEIIKGGIDIVFLDMKTRWMSLIKTLSELKAPKPHLIIISDNKGMAAEAFDYEISDYILKPVTHARLMRSVAKVINEINVGKTVSVDRTGLFIKVGQHLEKIETNDIYLIEALADYVNIYTPKKKFTVHSTMKRIEKIISPKDFMRVHKSYIIRLADISEIETENLAVHGKIIPVSMKYRKELRNHLQIV